MFKNLPRILLFPKASQNLGTALSETQNNTFVLNVLIIATSNIPSLIILVPTLTYLILVYKWVETLMVLFCVYMFSFFITFCIRKFDIL